MKLLVISDLHFSDRKNDWDRINKISESMYNVLENKVKRDEELLVIVLGDIIDSAGKPGEYIKAKYCAAGIFFDKFKEKISNAKFLFIPGNHELENDKGRLGLFNRFCKINGSFSKNKFTKSNSVNKFEFAGFEFFLVNSTLNKEHNAKGLIELSEIINNANNNEKKLIFMHHPPVITPGTDEKDDIKVIENSKEFIEKRLNFTFYGHQHGDVSNPDILIKDTYIHAVGSLFVEGKSVKNDFLLMDLDKGKFNYIMRYTYNGIKFAFDFITPKKVELKSDMLNYFGKPKIEDSNSIRSFSTIKESYKEKIDALTLINSNNRIMLVNDAGQGKSYELSCIYNSYCENEHYFPIWVCLRFTDEDQFKKYIDIAKNNTIDNKLPFLIIDGLEEISNEKIDDYIKLIGSIITENSETKILISARTTHNFHFDNFEEYKICALDDEQIKLISIKNDIKDFDKFFSCIKASGYKYLAINPFYLLELIKIYNQDYSFPIHSELFDQIILSRFIESDNKFNAIGENSLIFNQYKVIKYLCKFAFFLQSRQIYYLDNYTLTKYFPENARSFLNKVGFITKYTNNKLLDCGFEHNEFKEYLSAKYICELNLDDLLNILTYDEAKTRLRPSWENTIKFLLTLRKSGDLRKWLIDNEEQNKVLIKLERDFLTENERNNLFHMIFDNLNKKALHIYTLYNNLDDFVKYFNNEHTVDYLLKILKNRNGEYNRLIISSLYILAKFSMFYNRNDDLKDAIIPYFINENNFIVELSMEAYYNINLESPESTCNEILSFVENTLTERTSYKMLKLINLSGASDDFVDFIIDILVNIEKYDQYLLLNKNLQEIIVKFIKEKNILKILDILISRNYRYKDGYFEVTKKLIDKLFENNIEFSYEYIFSIYVKAIKLPYFKLKQYLNDLFLRYNLTEKIFNDLLEYNLGTFPKENAINGMMNDEVIDLLIEAFNKKKINESLYRSCALQFFDKAPVFTKLNNELSKKGLTPIVLDKMINENKSSVKDEQKYFDSLFDKNKYQEIINEAIIIIGEDSYCDKLFDKAVPKTQQEGGYYTSLLLTINHLKVNCRLSKFTEKVHWFYFSLNEIKDCLDNQNEILVSDNQVDFLKNQFYKLFNEIEFSKLYLGGNSYSYQIKFIKYLLFFMQKFKFPLEEQQLLELTFIPEGLDCESLNAYDNKVLKFIASKISDIDILHKKIIRNIKLKNLSPHVISNHIEYCLEHKLPDAIELSEKLFKSKSKDDFISYNYVIDYLIAMKGDKYLDDLIGEIDELEDNLLFMLSHKLGTNNKNYIEKLISKNENSEKKIKYLEYLIKLNTEYGIKSYIDITCETMTLPDINSKDTLYSTTEAISFINNINLLGYIKELYEICHNKKFVDISHWGLNPQLDKATLNLAEKDPFKTKEMLNSLIHENPFNDTLLRNINFLINRIDKLLNISNDLPCDIEKVVKFIKSKDENEIII